MKICSMFYKFLDYIDAELGIGIGVENILNKEIKYSLDSGGSVY